VQTSTVERAKGYWHWILEYANMDPDLLTDKHTACPICGGSDRFRFDDKEGRGTFFCNQCGSGDGMTLLGRWLSMDFAGTAARVDEILGDTKQPDAKKSFKQERSIADKQRALNELWNLDDFPALVDSYLVSRGLPDEMAQHMPDVKGCRMTPYWAGGVNRIREAMLARVRSAAGRPISIHRTYIGTADLGREKKTMPTLENLIGGAVRLTTNGYGASTLLVAEGIETALAGSIYVSDPADCWATLTANGMDGLVVPDHYERFIICADKDQSYTGQAAAYTLARRLQARKGTQAVEVVTPVETGCDMLDVVSKDVGVNYG